jgi:hypothetical protein
MARSDPLYQVKENFVTSVHGREMEYHKGEVVAGDDPGYRKSPHLFEPLVIRGQPAVEQATAAPGEQRGRAITTASFKGRT